MQDIKFLRDDAAKESEESLKEIQDILKKDPEKEKIREFGTRFLYSMMLASRTIKQRAEIKEQPRIQITEPIRRFIEHKTEVIPRLEMQKPDIKPKEAVPETTFPQQYALLLSNNKTLVSALVSKDEFGKLTYNLIEPKIDKRLIELIKKKISLRFRLNRKILEDDKYLIKKIRKASRKLKMQYQDDFLEGVRYFLFRDLINLGKIDSLFHDHGIKQVICDGENRALTIEHNSFGSLNSNIIMAKKEIDYIIAKIAEKKKEKITKKTQDFNIFIDGFRLKATLGSGMVSSKFILIKEIP